MMHAVRPLCGVLLLGIAQLTCAETNSYPESLAQAPELTLNMPAGTTTVTLPDAVGNAFLAAANRRAWRTEGRAVKVDYLRLDRTPENAYDDAVMPKTFVTYALSDAQGTRQSWFATVEARHDEHVAVELLVGIDSNDDGLPQASEEVCRVGPEQYDQQRCLLDLRGKTDHPLWAFAHVVGPNNTYYTPSDDVTVTIATADFQLSDGGTKVSVAPASDFLFARSANSGSAPVRVDFSYRPDAESAGSDPFEDVGGLLLTAADNALSTATAWPLRVHFTPVAEIGKGYAIAARYDEFDEVKVALKPNETYDGLYADNLGQDVLEVVVLNRDASVFIWNEPLPAASADSRATPVAPPAHTQGIILWPNAAPNAPNYAHVCPGCSNNLAVGQSRLHFSLRNMNSTQSISLRLRVRLPRAIDFATRQFPGLTSPSGNYFNPLRSGDGIFLDRVGGLQVFYWYTFDSNGQPVWYTAAANPSYDNGAVGTWNTTLYRITNRNLDRKVTPVGRIVLTSASYTTRELMFSWSIDGDTGSNRIQLAIAPRCTQQLPSLEFNLTGHWFNLSEPGWGTNLLGLRDGIAEGLYLFDAAGDPRWVFGGLSLSNNAWSGELYQFKGACPTCAYSAPTITSVGSAHLSFSSDSEARASYSVNFASPLHGTLTQSTVPVHRATSPVDCNLP